MLQNEKILITGISSTLAQELARPLVGANEVWGAARFSDPATLEHVTSAGITPVQVDLSLGDLSGLPSDFTYVLHLAYFRSPVPDFNEAFRVNGDAVGFVMNHCRSAKAALYMSSNVIYSMHEDPWFVHVEDGPIGWSKPGYSMTSTISKVAGEGVARYAARQFDLPVTIARLNAQYGPKTGMAMGAMESVIAGRDVVARWDPEPYTPIHVDDMSDQLEALLDAATTDATVVNWAGDEYVTVQEWSQYAAELAGTEANVEVRATEGSVRGSCASREKRLSITGPCKVPFKEGLASVYEARHGTVPTD